MTVVPGDDNVERREGWMMVKGKEKKKTKGRVDPANEDDTSTMDYANTDASPMIGRRSESKERPGRSTSTSRRCWQEGT